jgi:serine/threonine protein kinase
VGILAFEVLVGRAPFEQECKQTTCDLICYGDFVMPCFLSANAKDFIAKALCKKSATRPTIAQLLDHPWVAAEARRSSAIHPSLLPVVTVPASDGATGDASSQRQSVAKRVVSLAVGMPHTPPAAERLLASTTARKAT